MRTPATERDVLMRIQESEPMQFAMLTMTSNCGTSLGHEQSRTVYRW